MPDTLLYWRRFWRGRRVHAFPPGSRIPLCGAEATSGPGKGRPLSTPFGPADLHLLGSAACADCRAKAGRQP